MSTITALVIIEDNLHLLHAGDSRMLIVHGGEILQYTPDHSLAGFYGLETTQKTTRLYCALGSPHLKEHVIIEDITEEVSAGDTIHLMTDGLYPPESTTDYMLDFLEFSSKTTAKRLIGQASKYNLKDNMSIIELRIGT